jgi:glutamine amidotransferase-like uncharacterized protein
VSTAATSTKPLAIVYWGKGACLDCWMDAAIAAKVAGFRVKFVNQHLKDFSILNQAKIWIQPGGHSEDASVAMGPTYLQKIRDFISNGGGYVGFCAGAFLTTEMVGTTTQPGLGIVPGKTVLWSQINNAFTTPINFYGNTRYIYYHGGPSFDISGVTDPNLKVIAVYDDGKVAGVSTMYGKGKVATVGAHPEESAIAKLIHFVKDPDGSDRFLAVEMMKSVLQ